MTSLPKLRISLTPEQLACLKEVVAERHIAAYVRALIAADMRARGIDWPDTEVKAGGWRGGPKSKRNTP